MAAVVPGAPATADGDQGLEGRRIDIFNYRIEGNSVLARTAVERAVMPFLGPQRPLTDVEAARAALELAYRDAGYETVGVEVPEQDVRDGIVRINVNELTIGRLRVTDARYFSPEDIKARLPSLVEGTVPDYRAVSREIAAINKSGERMILPTLRAGDTPDTVDVDLRVEDRRPLHGSLEINDRFSARTDRLRVSAGLRHANLFQADHTLSVQGQFTPTDPGQSWSVSASYVAPIGNKGFSLLGYAVKSNSDVSAVSGIGVLGTGEIYGLRGLYSATGSIGADAIVHQLIVGADYKVFRESLVLDADRTDTPIDYFPITAQYTGAIRNEAYEFDVTLGFVAGLRGLSATNQEFALKRYDASASWIALKTELGAAANIGDWRASGRIAGQLASGPLISNEQFSAGGLDSVRGYYESQALGDDGLWSQIQLETPALIQGVGPISNLRLFAFADGALLRVRRPLEGQQGQIELASVGGGLTFRVFDTIGISGLVAAPLVDADQTRTDIGDSVRLMFRAGAEF